MSNNERGRQLKLSQEPKIRESMDGKGINKVHTSEGLSRYYIPRGWPLFGAERRHRCEYGPFPFGREQRASRPRKRTNNGRCHGHMQVGLTTVLQHTAPDEDSLVWPSDCSQVPEELSKNFTSRPIKHPIASINVGGAFGYGEDANGMEAMREPLLMRHVRGTTTWSSCRLFSSNSLPSQLRASWNPPKCRSG